MIHNTIIKSKENTKTLLVYRKAAVKSALQSLEPFLQHEEKIAKCRFVLNHITETRYDNLREEWKKLTEGIKLQSRMEL